MPAIARAVALFVVLVTAATPARAQENLDRDKSGSKLFAASCRQCHKSARGLAKGRLSFTLSYYLRQHYTSSAQTAQVLTAYLQSVDTPRGKARPSIRKAPPARATTGTTGTTGAATSRLPAGLLPEDRPLRPPAKVPKR
jgi:hypothetical protein